MTPLESYLSGLTVTEGRRAGEAFTVLPWQRRFLRGAFAEGVQSAALSVGRGNGKTALLSGVAAAAIDGPLAVPRAETIIVAASFAQAWIAFDHVREFLADKLADRKAWRVWDTAQQAAIQNRETGARVRVIGSDPKRAHGLAPVLVLADEPRNGRPRPGTAWWRRSARQRGSNRTTVSSRFGTRPADGEHWFGKMCPGPPTMPKRTRRRRTIHRFNAGRGRRPIQVCRTCRTWSRRSTRRPATRSAIRPSCTISRAPVERRSVGNRRGRADRGRNVGADRGRRRPGRAVCVGLRPGNQRRHVGNRRLLAGDRTLETVAAFPFDPPLAERGLA